MTKKLESNVTPFGGIHFLHKQLVSKGIIQFIDDVNYIREHTLEQLGHIQVPSADTILRGDVELTEPCDIIVSDSGVENKININPLMNRFLLHTALKFEQIDASRDDMTYDFDHQFIPAEKYDAKFSYKNKRGYFPGVATIDNVPVYVEGRNGNCNVKTEQLATHKRILGMLHSEGIMQKRARMDNGSYLKAVTDHFQEEGILFFIRAPQSETLLEKAAGAGNWHPCTINFQDMEAASFSYLFGGHEHRVVAYRVPNKTGQISAFTGDAKKYMFIITNDWEMTEKDVIEFYNKRGDSERVFDIQNNDFNWKSMPHSFLEENTVFLIIMAVAYVIYRWLVGIFASVAFGLAPTSRLKKFIFRLVNIVAKTTRSGRRTILHLATDNQQLIDFADAP